MAYTRRDVLLHGAATLTAASALAATAGGLHAAPSLKTTSARPNILFISIDDLNDRIGYLGSNPIARTPNMDRLALQGAALSRAYSQVPVCQPTRAATLFGKASWNMGNYTNDNVDWVEIPAYAGRMSLPRAFREQGYFTIGTGKHFHAGWNGKDGLEGSNDPGAWTEFHQLPRFNRSQCGFKKETYGPCGEVGDTTDDLRAAWMVRKVLNRRHDKPFFAALGFNKPHQSWAVPSAYFDMHPLDRVNYPAGVLDHDNPTLRANEDIADLPAAGLAFARQTHEWHRRFKADQGDFWRRAVQAYDAAVSSVDHALGIALDGLAKGPNAGDTIVLVWSDHGFQLGEKLSWLKHSLWERALHIPVLVAGPGIKPGNRADLFSTLDIYPTLCGLAGIEAPGDLDGIDQSKMIRRGSPGDRDIALSAWALDIEEGFSIAAGADWREDIHFSGRTKRHRLIRYGNGDLELYDHKVDPWEWRNIADQPQNRDIIERIAARMPDPADCAAPAPPDGGKGAGDD